MHTKIDAQARSLATRIAAYCEAQSLTLGGLAARIKQAGTFTPESAQELTTYCDQVQCLTLGGLVDEVWALRNAFHDAPMQMFKQACWLHLVFTINRYLMSCADGRQSGAEKALRHIELCRFYVAAVRGIDDVEQVRRGDHEDDYQAVHEATQALTDHLDDVIGFPLKVRPDYQALAPQFFEHFHTLAMSALSGKA